MPAGTAAPPPKDPTAAFVLRASQQVSRWSEREGLHPDTTDDPERPRYTIQQGLRAAHFAREDAATGLIVASAALKGTGRAEKMLWAIIALLALILWRVW